MQGAKVISDTSLFPHSQAIRPAMVTDVSQITGLDLRISQIAIRLLRLDMNSSQFYQAILDGFVSEGWVECVATEDGYTYYAIHPATTVSLMMAQEAAASIAIDQEIGTFSLE